ncbi:hypothetical protein GYMLUDRAFT_58397 [Collybiopsis luxurians FD-317 M1]|uniref:Uncharacterized protein n=1 Tax=Collybiopsis luxurians FD-317 M1 TaxID=944289 RepID=A0A0D0CHS0_9AGAR|nr:hypothetical protein GYMLUDRAFT_58397 [Collybiopsis luxurians FD-317 M1]
MASPSSDNDDDNDNITDVTETHKAVQEEEKDIAKRKAPVYAFFNAKPEIEFAKAGHTEYLVYSCANCSTMVKQGLKMADKGSTGNMNNHARRCRGEETFAAVKGSTLDKA